MRKLLIFIPIFASLGLAGCSSFSEVSDAIPNALDRAPLIYRPTIQQGNVVSQEQVNELKPGMSKRQVRFLLGTPMLADVFHANRWDYTYTEGVGSSPSDMRRVTVFFEDDRLVRITGDLSPQPEDERTESKKEVVVSVPDWDEPNKTLWRRFLDSIGLGDD
ncbi:MAG: outer membrane protein assembly factor BamE [Gammaproteobacteria bacterium]|nr:outer membrane protein assembly factor BamE [Gammaproteobacteria bacterium]